MNVRERVEQIRKRRDEHFQRRFGTSNEGELLKQFHREDLIEEARLKDAILQIAKGIKSAEKISKVF